MRVVVMMFGSRLRSGAALHQFAATGARASGPTSAPRDASAAAFKRGSPGFLRMGKETVFVPGAGASVGQITTRP
jgi:hypothetical protein